MRVALDASVALAWSFQDEGSDFAQHLFDADGIFDFLYGAGVDHGRSKKFRTFRTANLDHLEVKIRPKMRS